MRLVYLLIGLAIWVGNGPAFATSPEVVLRGMIELDMQGDPSGRLGLATPDAVVVVTVSRQIERARIAFELDADAIELATSWRLDTSPAKCSLTACQVHVVYRVVGTTVGTGIPSWDRNLGREIRPLPKGVERRVQYNLVNIDGAWRIEKLPPPYVSPKALDTFFRQEVERALVTTHAVVVDSRAAKNREVVEQWRQRQLDALRGLPP